MVNTRKEFPREYTDQVISWRTHDGGVQRAPGPGHKQQAPSSKPQATQTRKGTSCPFGKTQAGQDASHKLQVPSGKVQASSHKRQAS